jgi:hypothetical protein
MNLEPAAVNPKLRLHEVVERVAAAIPAARWKYDEEADEVEIVLPGVGPRPGRAILIDDDFYLRLDVDTNEPLTLLIPTFTDWVSRRAAGLVRAPQMSDPPGSWQGSSHAALSRSLGRTVQASGALAAAVA